MRMHAMPPAGGSATPELQGSVPPEFLDRFYTGNPPEDIPGNDARVFSMSRAWGHDGRP